MFHRWFRHYLIRPWGPCGLKCYSLRVADYEVGIVVVGNPGKFSINVQVEKWQPLIVVGFQDCRMVRAMAFRA